jgi:5-methylcytosine-specific restriction endonuclease McrA
MSPYVSKFAETLYDPAWLRKVYVDEGRNAAQVAELIGCTRGAVLDNLRKHHIPIKPRSEAQRLAPTRGSHVARPRKRFINTLHNETWLREHYVDKRMTATEVAHLAGSSVPSVLRALRVAEIEVRPMGAERIGRSNPKRQLRREDASTCALRKRARSKTPPSPCVVCGATGTQVNHKDRNPRNPATDNLERLCSACHGQQHGEEARVMAEWLRARGVAYLDIYAEARRRLLARV